jgi:hypothetical protein
MLQQEHPIIFFDKNATPEDEALKEALGKLWSSFNEIRKLSSGYQQEWKCYTKTIGWQLKVSKAKKALYWMTPLAAAFRISFSLREEERARLMETPPSPAVKEQLEMAQKYPEGWPLRLLVTKKSDAVVVKKVLTVVMEMRATG